MQGRPRTYKGGDRMVDTKVRLCGTELDNPVIPASGTFGYGWEFAELYDINCLGSISFKGTTAEARFGNPTPRIAECDGGMLNSVGLQNPGVEAVRTVELPKLRKCFAKPVMANIGGFSPEEYVNNIKALDGEDCIGWFEVNISCPNVHGGGLAFGTSAEGAAKITKAVRSATKKPVIIKLSPNVTDIAEIAKACEAEGADGLSLINTLLGMRIDLRSRRPVLANKAGGYSGPGSKARRTSHGLSGVRGGCNTHRRHGRHLLRRGRYRIYACGCLRRRSGCGEPYRALCLQKHYRRTACGNGKIRYKKSQRYNRRSTLMAKDVIIACDFAGEAQTLNFLTGSSQESPL